MYENMKFVLESVTSYRKANLADVRVLWTSDLFSEIYLSKRHQPEHDGQAI